MVKLYGLTVEKEASVLSAPSRNIRFGWKLLSDEESVFQTAYRIVIKRGESTVYDSGKVESDLSAEITAVCDLERGKEHGYTITSYTNKGEASAEGKFGVGLEDRDFTAKWIKPRKHIEGASVYFRKEFTVKAPVRRVIAYAVGLGYGVLYLNGERVGEGRLETPVSNYEKEVLYRAYDITSLVKEENCVGMHVGEGFYSQSRAWVGNAFKYGDITMLCEIRIEYEDGSEETVASDTSWQTAYSPCILSNVHGGEIYDARREIKDWCRVGCTDEDFTLAVPDTVQKGVLKGAIMPPVRIIRRVRPVSVTQLQGKDSGIWIYDMGENFAGTVTLRPPRSVRGATYVLRFAETVDASGQLDCRSIGVYHVYCQQQQIYIASGDENEEWTPEFSYHGFRYVEVTGYYGREPELDLLEGVALSTDFAETASITTSNDDLNRLYKIILRTMRSNYHGYPEDCPAREKCGWLGDAQIISDLALYNYDVTSSFEKYLSDIRTSRQVYGDFTMIAPGKRTCGFASPLWGCAVIIIPYNLYIYKGDLATVKEYYPDMKDWVEHELARAKDYIIDEGLGDWSPPIGTGDERRIPVIHSSSLMLIEETAKLAYLSRVLGKFEDGEYFDGISEAAKRSFIEKFYDKERHTYGYQASNAAAILLGVYPEGDREALLDATVKLIKEQDFVMTTGIYGNKQLIPMLFENGLGDIAMRIMFGRTFFDFGTMMDDHATSLWECLDMKHIGMKGEVSSYNHPMHAGFAYCYFSSLAGIKPVLPAFKEFEISPCTVGAPDTVKAEVETPYGRIVSERTGKKISISVPANTVCTLKLRGKAEKRLGSGSYEFDL